MNETTKTVGFLLAAVVAVFVGVWTHLGPAETAQGRQEIIGKSLFADLKPDSAKSLEIIEYDADTATLKPFKVAEENGVWRIPSHENYPADASQQLGEAAAALVACETINVETEDPSMHVTFGVVEPDPKSITAGTTGVGKRVTMEDGAGKKLAALIIGKPVKGGTDLYYVRKPQQDPVYVVKLKTDKFSTKFEDWIEKDLLKLNSWDVERVAFNDYSINELEGSVDMRSKIDVRFDSKESKWQLQELELFNRDAGEFQPEKLADDEELNSQKLNELKTALDDLKIVDVRRKPEGLAADLRAGEGLAANRESQESLLRAGFRLARIGDGPLEMVSNEGEVVCGTKEGVEYTLRFGRIAGSGEKEEESEEGKEKDEEESSSTGANRFIMVTAQFNEDLLTKPELEELPEVRDEADKAAPEGKEEAKEEVKKTSAVESALADADGQLALADDEKEKASDETAKPADKPAKETAAKKEAKSDKEKSAKPDAQKAPIAKPKSQEQLARERVEKENERKQKEYDDKVKKGKEKVKELSGRFADWYYVVSDSTYQKIHLGRDEIVKQKTPSADDKKKDEHDHEHEDKDDGALLKEEDKKLPD